MYKKINSLFRIVLIAFLLICISAMGLGSINAISYNRTFQKIISWILIISLGICVLFLVFYLVVGIVLLFKVMTREKIPFIKQKIVEIAVIWAIVSIIAVIFKFKSVTYLGMAIWSIFFTFTDIVKDEMARLDEIKENNDK